MSKKDGVIKFFASVQHAIDESDEKSNVVDNKFEQFRDYVWAKTGLANMLEMLKYKNYGKDLELILFQLYVFPGSEELESIKQIERYRPSEKSIGLSIVITQENFFDKTELDRRIFLGTSIMARLVLLAELVKRKKLDTDIDKLKLDVQALLEANDYPVEQATMLDRPATNKAQPSIVHKILKAFAKKQPTETKTELEPEADDDDEAVLINVTFHSNLDSPSEKLKKIRKLSNAIETILPDNSELDGHDIGDEDSTIFIYGESADMIWKSIESIIRKQDFAHIEVTLRYGSVDDVNMRERQVSVK